MVSLGVEMGSVLHVGALDVIVKPALEAANLLFGEKRREAALEVSVPLQSLPQHQVVLAPVRHGPRKTRLVEERFFMGKMSRGFFDQAIENLTHHFSALAARQRLICLVQQGDQLLVVVVLLLDTHAHLFCPEHFSRLHVVPLPTLRILRQPGGIRGRLAIPSRLGGQRRLQTPCLRESIGELEKNMNRVRKPFDHCAVAASLSNSSFSHLLKGANSSSRPRKSRTICLPGFEPPCSSTALR